MVVLRRRHTFQRCGFEACSFVSLINLYFFINRCRVIDRAGSCSSAFWSRVKFFHIPYRIACNIDYRKIKYIIELTGRLRCRRRIARWRKVIDLAYRFGLLAVTSCHLSKMRVRGRKHDKYVLLDYTLMDWQDDEWLNKPRSTTFRAKETLFFRVCSFFRNILPPDWLLPESGRTLSRQDR